MSVSERLTAALAGRYRLERELGAGGMATVYLAHDEKHERDVAIKVLHPDLGAALGADRFLAEIKTTAKLQHPHILPLLDSGAADGLLYYVMPYVSGETLRARLDREHPLPIGEALRVAREVGSALDFAHRAGIVHRDIKPENILLLDGQAVVADFGIALAVQTAGGQRMTQTGLSLGTPQYMSPEQAMGERALDARADVYALGAVTYEMLVGEPPFSGGSVQAIVAKILSERPVPLRTLRDTVPPAVEHAVLEALAKLPADRPATAAAFVARLEAPTAGSETSAVSTSARAQVRAKRGPWLAAAVAGNVLLAAVAAFAWLRPAPAPAVMRQQVVLWRQAIPNMLAAGAAYIATQAAIAPDGSSIVFTDSTTEGRLLLRKRRDRVQAEPMPATEGGINPVFSPDGRWVAFATTDGRLRKVPVEGGAAVTLSEDIRVDYKVTGWLDDGAIVFTRNTSGVMLLPADGGAARELRFPATMQGQLTSVSSLPGDRGFVGGICGGNCAFGSDAFVYDRRTDSLRIVVPRATAAWFTATGHLLYTVRDGGLFAVRFDLDKLTPVGEAVPVLDDVMPGSVALSRDGHLLYAQESAASAQAELVWVDRSGRESVFDAAWRGRFDYPAIAPDGKTVAVSVRDRTTDLWIRNAEGSRRQVVVSGVANWRPAWGPGGTSLYFVSLAPTSERQDQSSVMRVRADAAEAAVPVFQHRYGTWEAEVTPDGRYLVFRTDEPRSSSNIYVHPLVGDTTTRAFAADTMNEIQISLSPDGRRLAYTREVQGVSQVFVADFPEGKVRRMVSRAGGGEPRFSRSGQEVFFTSAGRLWTVGVSGGADITASEPRPLFALTNYRRARNRPQYDVAPGDQRFLMIKDPPPPPVPPLVYVEHWFTELRAKVPR